ncbi:MAG: hypothetical protein GF330_02930 [Candidatus Eisenbacteria bacterium]|nr:hypothetical protein [Candidatus Eisenbacteria bacterium]
MRPDAVRRSPGDAPSGFATGRVAPYGCHGRLAIAMLVLLISSLWLTVPSLALQIRVLDENAGQAVEPDEPEPGEQAAAAARAARALAEEEAERAKEAARIIVHTPAIDSLRGADDRPRETVPQRPVQEMVSMGDEVVVREDQLVTGDAVCILGSVRVLGTVTGDAVSIGGDVIVGPRGVVRGQAVCIGGRIEERPGAQIGERVQISFLPRIGGSGRIFASWSWVVLALHFLLIGLIGWVILKLSPRRWMAVIATLRDRSGGSLLAGIGTGIVYWILVVPLLAVLALVLAATVLGIPLVPVVLLLLLLLPVPGYAVTSALLGGALRGRSEQAARDADVGWIGGAFCLGHLLLSIPLLAGSLLYSITARSWVGLGTIMEAIAWGVILLAVAFGWGALLLSRFGRRFPGEAAPGAPVPSPDPTGGAQPPPGAAV